MIFIWSLWLDPGYNTHEGCVILLRRRGPVEKKINITMTAKNYKISLSFDKTKLRVEFTYKSGLLIDWSTDYSLCYS